MKEDLHREFEDLLPGMLSGELPAEDEVRFRQLIEADAELKARWKEYNRIWEGAGDGSRKSYDLDSEWSMLRGKLEGFGAAGLVPENESESFGPGTKRSFLYYTYRIAAVLVVGLLLGIAMQFAIGRLTTTRMTAGAEVLELQLEDGTLVMLNRYSSLEFRKKLSGKQREITLQGEAWFDVARDTLRPFVIDAGTALVEVLGTSFNVNAYGETGQVEITVESGIVSVTAKKDSEGHIVLRAGNSGTYNTASQELTLVPESIPNALSWKTRELVFDHAPLGEVVGVIAKVYDVEVKLVSPNLASCSLTTTFSGQSLESVLEVLELTLDLEVQRSGKKIEISGQSCMEDR